LAARNACSSCASCFCSCAISRCNACTVGLAELLLSDPPDAPAAAPPPTPFTATVVPVADEVGPPVVDDAEDDAPLMLTGMEEVSRWMPMLTRSPFVWSTSASAASLKT
jgi:hypothetical protein